MSEQKAVVTGAASGIGRECVRILLDRGHRVAALDLDEARLAREFASNDGVTRIALDLHDGTSCRNAVRDAIDVLGDIDAFLHFAAAWTGTTWEKSDAEEWGRILAINLTGTFLLTQAVAEHMVPRKKGAIVLTASDSAKVGGVAGGPAYVASKGGVIALTRSFAQALGPHGIRVNAVNPGLIETPMTDGWSEQLKRLTLERTPLRRLGRPGDIADVACFLASHEARFMTGEVVEVNGGFYFD